MKILVIASHPESLILFRSDLLNQMLACGHQVHAASPGLETDTRTRDTLRRMGVLAWTIPLWRNRMNPFRDGHTLLALWWLMRKLRPTHVLAYTVKPVIYGMIAANLCRVQKRIALISGLGYAFTSESRGLRRVMKELLQRLYRLALSTAQVVVFQNPDDRGLFENLGVVTTQKCMQVNGSGINIERFKVAGFPDVDHGVHFLLIARLLKDKGVAEYVAAARTVRARYPNGRFHLVGGVDSNPTAIDPKDLDSWIEAGVIEYHGRLSDVRPILEQVHVYVLPSYREGTPRTVLEAMSMGRPIITTSAPGCRETIMTLEGKSVDKDSKDFIQGQNGFCVPVKNVEKLVEAMEQFVLHPDLIREMGQRSREIAEQKYDVRKVNDVMLRAMGL
jgi:glycosyltransferase involved in cell wall biosynthesis